MLWDTLQPRVCPTRWYIQNRHWGTSYVPCGGTGCSPRWYGILFFPTATTGGIDEYFSLPFFEVPGRRVRAVGEICKAKFRSDTASIRAEKSLAGFAQKAIVLILRIPAGDRILAETERLGRGAAGSKYLAVIEAVVAQPSTPIDP